MGTEGLLDIKEITKRLDAIIRILVEQAQEKGVTARETIKELSDVGMKDFEIAKILGRSRGYVSGELAQIRKSRRKKS